MAITRLNSLAIPAGTVETADLSYPLTNFSSTGIDDNATSTAITIDSSENVTVSGNFSATKLSALNGILELDDNGTHNGIINVPASLFLNLDSDNTNTGEYFAIAKDRTGTSGGTELFRIQEDGNVGIGTTSPGSSTNYNTLTINGTTGGIIEFHSGGSLQSYILGNSSELRMQSQSTQPLTFNTNGTERMRIDSLGNLLVGKASTDYGNSTRKEFNLYGTNEAIITLDTGNASPFYLNNNNGGVDIWNQNNNYMRFATNSTERMRIDSNGNVGIGTSSPSVGLEVKETGNAEMKLNSVGDLAQILFTATDANAVAQLNFQDNGVNFQGGISYYHNGDSMRFRTAADERMRIDSSGNVGIGTSSPSNKLHVQTGTTGTIARFEGSSGRYLYTGTDGGGHYVEAVGTTGAERVLRLQASNGSGTYTQLFIDGGNGYISTSSTAHFYVGGYSYQNSTGHALYKEGNHHLSINTNSYGSEVILLNNLTTSGVCSFLQYRTNGSAHGSLYAATNGLTIQNSSDYRIKNNVNNLTGALDIIKDLRPVKFTLYDETEIRTGFIAHEVDETIPDTDMVYGEKDAVDENGDIVCQTLGMGTNMFAYLVGAIKEQQAMIETLEAEVAALKGA